MSGSSEEYLASLGFDTSDVDKAVNQTVTLLGHLGNQFDDISRKTERAERALSGEGPRRYASAAKGASAATLELRQAIYDQAQAYSRLDTAQKSAQSNLAQMTAREREFAKFLADGQANDQASRSTQARARALDLERQAIDRAAQARQGLVAQTRGEERARESELASLRSAIQARAEEQRLLQSEEPNFVRLRYALYDVSNAFAVGGAAALAFTAGIVGTGVAFGREFADVRRTVGVTGVAARELYADFIRLTTDIPVAFSSLTEIGTAAGQLGIAEDRVASFTRTVAEFSATTDVSVASSATAFGRLDSLIEGVDGRYANLASSILNVGVNSVATESQIISIASQIAATGDQAGLTADEVIGLSGALASLGVAPEAARGTVLRVFSQINAAVSQGGETLNNFATLSQMSATQFQQAWSTDFTSTFVALLRGIDANGQGAEATLRALGITAARDVSALLKLSQNADDVQQYMRLAADGFANAGILADSFGVIAETNASRIQVLVQTVQAFAASVGEASSGPLSGFLAYLQRLLEAATRLANTPIGQSVSFFATVLGAVLAVMLLVTAAATRGAGSFLALRTAIGEVALVTAAANGGLKGFAATLLGATGAANAFGAAMKATGVGLLITGGLYLLGEAVTAISKQMESGKDQALDYFGTLDGLSEAIRADNTEIFAQQAEQAKEAISGVVTSGGNWITVLENAAEAQAALANSTGGSNAKIDEQTLSIGRNTQEWLRNQLASNENFRKIFSNLDALKQLQASTFTGGGVNFGGFQPFDVQEFANQLASGGVDAGQKYIAAFEQGLTEAAQRTGDATALNAVEAFLVSNESLNAAKEAAAQVSNALSEGLSEAAQTDAIGQVLDNAFGQVEDSAEDVSSTFQQLMTDVYGVINAELQLRQATFALGEEFATNGADIASSGSQMQAVIQAIFASSSGAPEAASRLQGLFNTLVQGGYASASQLAPLAAIIAGLAGGKDVTAATFDMSNFAAGMDKVARSAGGSGGSGSGGAAKAVRTLVDYANDLRAVLSRSFDIRFGGQQAMDDVASGWSAIRESIAQVNQEISEYQADMQQLSADRDVREYWLRVAENYGDALRAGELRAEISEIDNKLAKTSSDLTSAQEKNSRTLDGNSDAAIENREKILGLVSGYQNYIQSLAAAGVPQEQLQAEAARLKQEFIAQATQLGYNVGELDRYSAAFDDVTTAIGRVPRNITVEANIDPALQALNELDAKAASLAGKSYQGPTIVGGGLSDESNKAARGQAILGQIAALQQGAALGIGGLEAGLELKRLQNLLASGNYRSGTGWTGSGNPWEPAGIVHNRERVLNERGSQLVSGQFVNAANQGRNPWQYAPQQSSQVRMPDRIMVELSPVDRELMIQGKTVTAVISPSEMAGATSSVNADDSRRGGA